MSVRFQYNKTSLQQINKQLLMRVKALPTLKNKESALRLEVKNSRNKCIALEKELEDLIVGQRNDIHMWNEFDKELVKIDQIILKNRTIAGIKTPELDKLTFHIKDFFLFGKPKWYLDGIKTFQKIMTLVIEKEITGKKVGLLEYARKKTTQKVNLYEKVQIPALNNAIVKIKRFLEDEENLSKASQKIVKNRQESEEVLI